MTTTDISKDLEERRAARRASARQAAAPEVARIQAEQARRASLSDEARRYEDLTQALIGVRFRGIRDYEVQPPVQVDGRWQDRIRFTTNGVDWVTGEVVRHRGQVAQIRTVANPDAPWLPLYADDHTL